MEEKAICNLLNMEKSYLRSSGSCDKIMNEIDVYSVTVWSDDSRLSGELQENSFIFNFEILTNFN